VRPVRPSSCVGGAGQEIAQRGRGGRPRGILGPEADRRRGTPCRVTVRDAASACGYRRCGPGRQPAAVPIRHPDARMHLPRFVPVALFVLVAASIEVSQTSDVSTHLALLPAVAISPDPETVRIEGRVVGSDGPLAASPLAGSTVRLVTADLGPARSDKEERSASMRYAGTSFEQEAGPGGTFAFDVEARGKVVRLSARAPGSLWFTVPTELRLAPYQATRRIDIELRVVRATVRGMVRREDLDESGDLCSSHTANSRLGCSTRLCCAAAGTRSLPRLPAARRGRTEGMPTRRRPVVRAPRCPRRSLGASDRPPIRLPDDDAVPASDPGRDGRNGRSRDRWRPESGCPLRSLDRRRRAVVLAGAPGRTGDRRRGRSMAGSGRPARDRSARAARGLEERAAARSTSTDRTARRDLSAVTA
jgi:hypothetical protein